jgi:hypothetical protein
MSSNPDNVRKKIMARSFTAAQINAIRRKNALKNGTKPVSASTAPTPVRNIRTAPKSIDADAPKRPAFRDRRNDRISVTLVPATLGFNVQVRYTVRKGETVKDIHAAFDRLYWKGAGAIAIGGMCVRESSYVEGDLTGEWMADSPLNEFKRNNRRPRDAAHAAQMDKDREREALLFAISYDPGRSISLRNGNW